MPLVRELAHFTVLDPVSRNALQRLESGPSAAELQAYGIAPPPIPDQPLCSLVSGAFEAYAEQGVTVTAHPGPSGSGLAPSCTVTLTPFSTGLYVALSADTGYAPVHITSHPTRPGSYRVRFVPLLDPSFLRRGAPADPSASSGPISCDHVASQAYGAVLRGATSLGVLSDRLNALFACVPGAGAWTLQVGPTVLHGASGLLVANGVPSERWRSVGPYLLYEGKLTDLLDPDIGAVGFDLLVPSEDLPGS